MFRKIVLSALALSLLAGTAVVHAQDAGSSAPEASVSRDSGAKSRQGRMFEQLDADKDGKISAAELSAPHIDRLKAADANGDGELSKEELTDFVQKRAAERRAERMAKRLDINGDGTVTIEEIEGHQAKRFALADRNDDGVLDQDELRKVSGKHGMKKGMRHGRHMERGGMHERHGMRQHMRKMHDDRASAPTAPQDAPAE
ncbi:EF-hand domain-containing protein [Nitratireductor sp. CH_MIT9313-5]|uniref:EF-hand domain-containing protein n=1 Tax=Nitratireductor sp. CH_MIT9313-5 TaxID=3107764 RepID=UPI00300B3F3A